MRYQREDIQAAAGGDRDAFERLVRAVQAAVVAYALHLVGNLPDAEDVAQEALLKVWLQLRELRDPERFEPWLRRIVARAAASWRRRQCLTVPFVDEPADPRADVRAAYERRALSATVRAALATLSAANREAVVLHYLGGLSQREAADFLGVSESAVAVRLHRARARLRTELAAFGDELRANRPAEEFTRMVMAQVMHAVSTQNRNILVLKDNQDRVFSMHTTSDQVRAIRRAMLGPERFARPEPHELMLAALRAYDIAVVEARLDRLEDSVFKATIVLDRRGERIDLDSRATDAVVVSLLAGAPLQVDDQVVVHSQYRDGEGQPMSAAGVVEELAQYGVHLQVVDGFGHGQFERWPDGRCTVLLDAEAAELRVSTELVPADAPESCPVWFDVVPDEPQPGPGTLLLFEVAGSFRDDGGSVVLEAQLGGRTVLLPYPQAVFEGLRRDLDGGTYALVCHDGEHGWRLVLDLKTWRGRATAPVERSLDYQMLAIDRLGLSSSRFEETDDGFVVTGFDESREVGLQWLPAALGAAVMERFRTLFEMAAPGEGETTTASWRPMVFGTTYDMELRLSLHGSQRALEIDYTRLPPAAGP